MAIYETMRFDDSSNSLQPAAVYGHIDVAGESGRWRINLDYMQVRSEAANDPNWNPSFL